MMRKESKKVSKKVDKKILIGTIRIKTKGFGVFEKTANSWKKSKKKFSEVIQVIKLFKSNNNFDFLIDRKNPQFLKGQFSKDGKCQGARINILPNGQELEGAYSLFARYLTIHDESSNLHWDVIYQNPNGKYAYLYTVEKRKLAVKKKYMNVVEFEKLYINLKKNVLNALNDRDDNMAVAIFTLLETKMRVGNEMYYKLDGHKGLTTLTKEDVKIKSNIVTFEYEGKDGVPIKITEEFPELYVNRLKEIIKPLKKSSFIFVGNNGHPLKDIQFKKAFKHYCGKEFYPHIVRSHYATNQAEEFIKTHKKATKTEITELFFRISNKLGHKRFVKKDNEWKDSYTTTIHHYIEPSLVEKIQNLVGK